MARWIQVSEVSVLAGVVNETYFGSAGDRIIWIDYDNDGWNDMFAPNGFGFSAHLCQNVGLSSNPC